MVSIKSILSIFLISNLLMTIYLNEYIAHIFFYFSYWGVFTSFLAMFFSIRAYNYKKNNQAPAVIFTEISICYNIVIVPVFWAMIAPNEFSKYPKWKGLDLVTKIHLTTTHTIPIIASLTNIYISKTWYSSQKTGKLCFWAEWCTFMQTIWGLRWKAVQCTQLLTGQMFLSLYCAISLPQFLSHLFSIMLLCTLKLPRLFENI